MLLAKPNPQNYYSVTVALFRPNLLIELKRFLFISFSLYSCLLSFLSSYSLFFCFPFLFIFLFIFLFMFSCCLVFFVSVLPLLFSYFHVGAMSFLYAQRCSRRICVVSLIYNNVGVLKSLGRLLFSFINVRKGKTKILMCKTKQRKNNIL